jgi:valyl-tRNA synthetase
MNKLFQAARFVRMHVDEETARELPGRLTVVDRWILSRLQRAVDEVRRGIEEYRFNDAGQAFYQFTWHEFCDWYIEMSKLALSSSDDAVAARSRAILRELLDQILLLLHPIVPFVTEEIWQVLGSGRDSIMVQAYPAERPGWRDHETEKAMAFLTGVVRAVRNLRSEMNCPPGKQVKAIFCGPQEDLAFLRAQQPYLSALARVGAAEFRTDGERPKGAATAIVAAVEIYLPLDELVHLDEERARLAKEVGKIEGELTRVRKKLANADFLAKAKNEVVDKEREKASQFEEKIRTLRTSLEKIEELQAGRN